MRSFLTLSLLASTLFPSCATIVSDNKYSVTVWTEPDGATVEIQDEDGHVVHRGVTPLSIELSTKDGWFTGMDYVALVSMEGYQPDKVEIPSNFDEWYLGNVVFGGLLGLIFVDPLTGSMWEFDPRYGKPLEAIRPPAVALAAASSAE